MITNFAWTTHFKITYIHESIWNTDTQSPIRRPLRSTPLLPL